jgi:hypothetical protein
MYTLRELRELKGGGDDPARDNPCPAQPQVLLEGMAPVVA